MNLLFYVGCVLGKLTVPYIMGIIFTNYQPVETFHWNESLEYFK